MKFVDKIKKMREDMQKLIQAEGEQAVKELVKTFFEASQGKFDAIRWRQYTPYFNDGDPCVFNLHGVYFREAGTPEDTEEGDYEDDFESPWHYKSTYNGNVPNEELYNLTQAFENELENLSDVLLSCFGDHVMITATADKIEIEDCGHD